MISGYDTALNATSDNVRFHLMASHELGLTEMTSEMDAGGRFVISAGSTSLYDSNINFYFTYFYCKYTLLMVTDVPFAEAVMTKQNEAIKHQPETEKHILSIILQPNKVF